METITVALGERSYPVRIGAGLLDQAGEQLSQAGIARCALITDDNVAPLYLQRVCSALDSAGVAHSELVLPHGEATKCMARLEEILSFLAEARFTRQDAVAALGGGVIGDLAGFAAATWLRGVRFVQLPTSLLAQVDSSVGGKVAVNLPQGKNLVGAFWQPSLVLCDPDCLQTLDRHYWLDGLGEVVKYGAIGDETLFALLERCAAGGREALMGRMEEILRRCVGYKAAVVSQDETEQGLRMTLNFGHTLGHAVELCQQYRGLSHGMAVAAGMAAITRLSEAKGLTVAGTSERLNALLSALGLPTALPELPPVQLVDALGMDKKNSAAGLRLVLLDDIGHCRVLPAGMEFFAGL